MKSLAGGGRRFYVLEHKVSSRYHKAGENQRIIVDQIELGRDPRCQVRFDDSFTTVSRRHAAIVKDGDGWKLIQLSKTNPTYLNGVRVDSMWYLQNGDEIQLATNGPKIGFILPAGDQGLVRSIGLSARMSLFRKQALRPYRTAITAMGCVLLALAAVGGYFLFDQARTIREQRELIASHKVEADRAKAIQDSVITQLSEENAGLAADVEARKKEMERLRGQLGRVQRTVDNINTVTSSVDNSAIDACLPGVFFIKTVSFDITLPDGTSGSLDCSDDGVPGWSGSGFLLSDGRFVTARHVAEGWYFWQDGGGRDDTMLELNKIANNGGKVVCNFVAVSSSGQQIKFSSDQCRTDRSHDRTGNTDSGEIISLARIDNTDYAYFRANASGGGLPHDADKSSRLERGTKLTVLGFPLGIGYKSTSEVNPIYGSGIVAVQGLQDGVILTTDTNYEQGNSGGPVFYTDSDGKLVVIGLVSAGAGRTTGFIVPLSAIK